MKRISWISSFTITPLFPFVAHANSIDPEVYRSIIWHNAIIRVGYPAVIVLLIIWAILVALGIRLHKRESTKWKKILYWIGFIVFGIVITAGLIVRLNWYGAQEWRFPPAYRSPPSIQREIVKSSYACVKDGDCVTTFYHQQTCYQSCNEELMNEQEAQARAAWRVENCSEMVIPSASVCMSRLRLMELRCEESHCMATSERTIYD